MDIQSPIQDAFICAAKYRAKNSNENLYLYQLGTDQLENLFSVIRTITHSSTCDFLELNDWLKLAYQVEQVYNDRPDWRPNNRLSTKTKITTTLDHSSVHSWTGDLSTINLGLETIWEIGCENAKTILKEFGFLDDEFCLNYDVTTLSPINVQINDNDEEEADDEYIQSNLANTWMIKSYLIQPSV